MELEFYIPWTPRTRIGQQINKAKVLCERTLDVLKPVIYKALAPFPAAASALAQALLALDAELASP